MKTTRKTTYIMENDLKWSIGMTVIHEIAKGHLLVSIRVWLLLLELILYVVFRQTIERNLSQTSILPKNNLPWYICMYFWSNYLKFKGNKASFETISSDKLLRFAKIQTYCKYQISFCAPSQKCHLFDPHCEY